MLRLCRCRTKNRNRYDTDMIFVTIGEKRQRFQCLLRRDTCYGSAHYGETLVSSVGRNVTGFLPRESWLRSAEKSSKNVSVESAA